MDLARILYADSTYQGEQYGIKFIFIAPSCTSYKIKHASMIMQLDFGRCCECDFWAICVS